MPKVYFEDCKYVGMSDYTGKDHFCKYRITAIKSRVDTYYEPASSERVFVEGMCTARNLNNDCLYYVER